MSYPREQHYYHAPPTQRCAGGSTGKCERCDGLANEVQALKDQIQTLTANLVDIQDSNGNTSFRAFRA